MERIDKYKKYFTKEYLMGPNSLRIADELIKRYPLQLNCENIILELGCGTGLSSLFIATFRQGSSNNQGRCDSVQYAILMEDYYE